MTHITYSLEELSQKQKITIAYYFYKFCKINYFSCILHHYKIQELYVSLVKSLHLEEHSIKIINSIIKLHIQLKNLTPYNIPPKYKHPFARKYALKKNFIEDEKIDEEYAHDWDSHTENEINLIRAVFAGKHNCLDKLIAYTFFMPEKKDEKFFIIPEESVINSKINNYDIDKSCVQFLIDDFRLSVTEGYLLNLAYYLNTVDVLQWFIDDGVGGKRYSASRISLYASFSDNAPLEIDRLFRKNQKLVSMGLFCDNGEIYDETLHCIIDGATDALFDDVLKIDNKKSYKIETFNIKDTEINLAKKLLQSNNAVNLLLYGAPGAGKTEFARSLVHSLNLKPLIFRNENEVSDEKAENKILCRINSLLALDKKDSVIIVDEAEGILKTQGSFFGMQYSLPQKGIVNKMLEDSQNRVIWILNYTHELDESTRRRFTYAIKFNEMTPAMLRSIADSKLNKIKMSYNLHSEIVDLCGKYHVTGASVDNIVKTISNMDLSIKNHPQVISDIKKVLESNSALIFGKKKIRDLVHSDYDLSVLNTTIPAEEIVDMVMNAQQYAQENEKDQNGIRMLFYGLSGTGKTEFARYIAEKLNKKIILKRPSDILGKYVGDNETNIQKAFEQAESSGDILLFDEADSFFADRTTLDRSWERSTVNEFLTQMEEFSGILICTTNLRQLMDPAMQRRFHILTEFRPLDSKGIEILLSKYFETFEFNQNILDKILKYETVTPGDFEQLYGKIRFMAKDLVSPESIINELCKIQEEKEVNHKSIGFSA